MTAYLITRPETWTLCALLHLPVQPGSVLNDWLSSGGFPESPDPATESLEALARKQVYFPANTGQPFDPMLLSSLGMASVNAAEITLIIRRAGQASMTRFAQVGEGLVQFGMDEKNLTLQPVTRREEVTNIIIPAWFTVSQNERLRAEIPLGAFLLFKQACVRADLALAESDFTSETFKKSSLLKQFTSTSAWVDIFNAEGVKGVLSVDQMPLEDYLNQLINMGYIQEMESDSLEIGYAGKPLAAALSDADLCSLTVSLRIWEDGFPETGVFLHGGGRLFLIDLKPGKVFIQQLADLQAGRSWIEKLLAKGAAAHYANYIIPSAPAPAPESLAPSSRQEPAPTFTEGNPPAPVATLLAADATLIESKPVSVEIVVLNGELENRRFPVGDQLRLGREADNDLPLPDQKASRHHAMLQRQGVVYQISDLNSGNGTYVNGKRITEPTLLKNGDILQIGDTKLSINDRP